MNSEEHVLICGASARAAAFSALRAGMKPWCADLFADADLRARCPVVAISRRKYPQGLIEVMKEGPPGPWLYTGAMENRPRLVGAISRTRPLWGHGPQVLRRVRDPSILAASLAAAGLPVPDVSLRPDGLPQDGSWMVKPRHGSGGVGIEAWRGQARSARVYFQQRIEGEPCAAVFLGDGHKAILLGVTRQLVGAPWLHARPFSYCGSVGPLQLSADALARFEKLGQVLAQSFQLRGLFGVDCVLQDGWPWTVEVNPRYTASVEVLEHATESAFLARHRAAFEDTDLSVPPLSSAGFVGKAILFAARPLVFAEQGPWLGCLPPTDLNECPEFADIPAAGTRIETGWPIMTVFARADSLEACGEALKRKVRDLDRWLARR